MTDIQITISQAVDGYNAHNDADINEHDLLDPIVQEHSVFDSFDDLRIEAGLNEDYEGVEIGDFDGMIRQTIAHIKVSDLHSLLTLAMNEYSEE